MSCFPKRTQAGFTMVSAIFIVVVLAALGAGIYPARRLSKLITAQALRNE